MRTKVKLHGELGKQVGKSEWNLCVSSASEAIHAINAQTGKKLYKQFIENDKSNIKYRVLIDGEDFECSDKLNNNIDDEKELKEDIENIQSSGLLIRKKIKRIDIIPVIEGASAVFNIIVGTLLMIAGALSGNPALFMAGLSLVASGVMAMLMEPPEFGEIKKIEGMTSASYLFNGPVNTIREGGVVPLIYGQVLAGSQVLAAWYKIYNVSAQAGSVTT
jgi:predicted phage tail protein